MRSRTVLPSLDKYVYIYMLYIAVYATIVTPLKSPAEASILRGPRERRPFPRTASTAPCFASPEETTDRATNAEAVAERPNSAAAVVALVALMTMTNRVISLAKEGGEGGEGGSFRVVVQK